MIRSSATSYNPQVIVYVGAGSGPFRDLVIAAGHGQMVSRQAGAFRMPERGRWAFDNGAWVDFMRGERFDPEQYLKRLGQINALPDNRIPDWCVCPDEVAAHGSLIYSLEWKSSLTGMAPRLKWYLALQDGMSPTDVDHALCLERFHGLFVGGSSAWKIESSPGWVKFGHERGLPVHIARVNGPNRLQWAVDIGADSIDGTGWVRAGAKWLPWLQNVPAAQARILEMGMPQAEFEAYLKEIWSDPSAWQTRFPVAGEDDWERYDVISAMGPVEFMAWYQNSYPVGYRLDAELVPEDPDEFRQWKFGLVDEAERHLGPRPVRPAAPRGRFVMDPEGKAVPLGFALMHGGVPQACGADGRPAVSWRGCVLPVISALSVEEADQVIAQSGKPHAPPAADCKS